MSGAPENEQKEPCRGEEAPKVRFANEKAELLQNMDNRKINESCLHERAYNTAYERSARE